MITKQVFNKSESLVKRIHCILKLRSDETCTPKTVNKKKKPPLNIQWKTGYP